MRLLNTRNFSFKEFFDSEIPSYAILSHRWQGKEPSYQEFLAAPHDSRLNEEKFAKIRGACNVARESRLDWIWIDNICIDKTSSAELSESINSMYRWYKQAEICFVYLEDVQTVRTSQSLRSRTLCLDPEKFLEAIKRSAWFTRGWTLQELLAPSECSFYDSRWKYMGDRDVYDEAIQDITGIEMTNHALASVAQKMSWVSRRSTSRGEDIAYCMLGLFDVNMPLLYGEGSQKAFIRLQMEIIKKSNDETIFAWEGFMANGYSGLLAPGPECFKSSGDVVPISLAGSRKPFSMTNKGLEIEIWDMPIDLGSPDFKFQYRNPDYMPKYLILDAARFRVAERTRIVIVLERYLAFEDVYVRTNPALIECSMGYCFPSHGRQPRTVYIQQGWR